VAPREQSSPDSHSAAAEHLGGGQVLFEYAQDPAPPPVQPTNQKFRSDASVGGSHGVIAYTGEFIVREPGKGEVFRGYSAEFDDFVPKESLEYTAALEWLGLADSETDESKRAKPGAAGELFARCEEVDGLEREPLAIGVSEVGGVLNPEFDQPIEVDQR